MKPLAASQKCPPCLLCWKWSHNIWSCTREATETFLNSHFAVHKK
jgi:hypothetical protein